MVVITSKQVPVPIPSPALEAPLHTPPPPRPITKPSSSTLTSSLPSVGDGSKSSRTPSSDNVPIISQIDSCNNSTTSSMKSLPGVTTLRQHGRSDSSCTESSTEGESSDALDDDTPANHYSNKCHMAAAGDTLRANEDKDATLKAKENGKDREPIIERVNTKNTIQQNKVRYCFYCL